MTPYLEDADLTLYQGDALTVLRELPAESVHCVVTSPPYWGLRDYGTGRWEGGDAECDHLGRPHSRKAGFNERWYGEQAAGWENKQGEQRAHFNEVCGKCGARRVDNQFGLEPTPELYVANMVEVFREVRRVLRADGTCWVNMGDSYNSNESGGMTGSTLAKGGKQTAHNRIGKQRAGGLKVKDLVMIPARLALALQADGWWLRSQIVWSKPNPMPESVTDRPTTSHEFVYLLAKSPRDFWLGVFWNHVRAGGPRDRFLLVYVCVVPCVPLALVWRLGGMA